MRLMLALMFTSLLIAPGALADSDAVTPLHEECSEDLPPAEHAECHDEKESPGIGLLVSVGALGALAFLARRRNA